MAKINRSEATLLRGDVVTLQHTSSVLSNNPLGDPTTRPLSIYLPAIYARSSSRKRRFPVLYCLAGFTGSGPGQLNWKGFEENIIQRLDRLIANNDMPPAIVAFPDCFTAFGGTQYINSSAIGDYADYLNLELVPFIDANFRTKAGRDHRGCFGKSSGGYGALTLAMRYPKVWGAVACHSSDAYFDFVYRSDWPGVLTHLQRYAPAAGKRRPALQQAVPGEDDGRVSRFLQDLRSRPPGGANKISGNEMMSLMLLGMAASYDPNPSVANGFYLPFDLQSGALLPKRWRNWLRHDPINLVTRYRNNLQQLRALYLDCGRADQFHIHYGNRQLSQALDDAQVQHRYSEFDGTHSGIDHRLDISLPLLVKRLR